MNDPQVLSPLTTTISPARATAPIPVQRPVETTLQGFDSDQFANDWPHVSRVICQRLASCGCPTCDREDIAQETAIRLLRRQLPNVNAADLEHYAVRVAKNLYISQWRKPGLVTVALEESAGVTDADDPAVTMERRLAIEAISLGWQSLTLEEQSLLSDENDKPNDRKEANRRNVQRHRLRVRLKALTAGLIGATVALLATPRGHAPTQSPRPAASHPHPLRCCRTTPKTTRDV